jgi:hypothetical protein
MQSHNYFSLKIRGDNLIIDTRNWLPRSHENTKDFSSNLKSYYSEIIQKYDLSSIIRVTIHGLSSTIVFKHEYINILLSSSEIEKHKLTFMIINDDLYGRHLTAILEIIARSVPTYPGDSSDSSVPTYPGDSSDPSPSVTTYSGDSSIPNPGVPGSTSCNMVPKYEKIADTYRICLPNHFEAFDMQNRLIPTDEVKAQLDDNKTFDLRKSSCLLVVGQSFNEELKDPIKILGLTQIRLTYAKGQDIIIPT